MTEKKYRPAITFVTPKEMGDGFIKESSTLVAHNANAYMLFYEREIENVSKPNGISPSDARIPMHPQLKEVPSPVLYLK
jgi:hypothetical protein